MTDLVPCPVVSWCTGHPQWEIDRPDDYVHQSEPRTLVEIPATDANQLPEDLVIERQLIAGRGHEFYFMYGNINYVIEVDELTQMAGRFEVAAARLRELAHSDEAQNARRIRE